VSATGGRVFQSVDGLSAAISRAGSTIDTSSAWDTWPFLAILAVLAFTLDVTMRRLRWFSKETEGASAEVGAGEAGSYKRIADQYLQMAKEYDRKGNERQAQNYYLKARSFYLKARHTDNANRMWERYRHLEQKRAG